MSPRRRGLAAATLALVGATACATGAGDPAGPAAADRSPPASPSVEVHSDYYFSISSMTEMLRISDAVVIGVVESAYRAETLGPAEDPTTHRILRVTVKQSFKGEETQLKVRTLGWTERDGAELRLIDPQQPWLEVGTRIAVALQHSSPGLFDIAAPQALFILAGGEVVDTARSGRFLREVESLTVAQLVAQLDEARG